MSIPKLIELRKVRIIPRLPPSDGECIFPHVRGYHGVTPGRSQNKRQNAFDLRRDYRIKSGKGEF
jgi:hypothetical protein